MVIDEIILLEVTTVVHGGTTVIHIRCVQVSVIVMGILTVDRILLIRKDAMVIDEVNYKAVVDVANYVVLKVRIEKDEVHTVVDKRANVYVSKV